MTDEVAIAERFRRLQLENDRLLARVVDLERLGLEKERIERQLRETHAGLEQRVNERTAALASAHEDLKTLLSIVSHDLRAPLINVKGFAGELRSSCVQLRGLLLPHLEAMSEADREEALNLIDQELPEALGFIDASIDRINHFMATLLRLSQEGKRELSMEWVDVEVLVRELLRSLAFQIEQHRAVVTVHPLPKVVADRISLEQILGNLLSNAVLYLDPGRPGRIELRGQRLAEQVRFEIEDNGVGIPEEDLGKVFAPFRRGRNTEVEGEGMGLAFVQALVRRHGGRIGCRSTPGVGSTFFFTLSARLFEEDQRSTMEILSG